MRSRFLRTVQVMDPTLLWMLDDAYGASDLSGNGRDGTGGGDIVIGDAADLLAFEDAGATTFDASNDRVATSYAIWSDTQERTLVALAAKTTLTNATIFAGDVSADSPALAVQALSANVRFRVRDNDTSAASQATWTDAWPATTGPVLCGLDVDLGDDQAELYINGVSKGVVAGLTQTLLNAGNLKVGARGSATNPFGGSIGPVCCFERLLSAREHLRLAKATLEGLSG